MPLYEYKCDRCGDVFEIIQKFSDEPLQVHEKCGGTVERLVSRSALQFKGSGWYVNDYAKSNGGSKKETTDSKGASDKDTSAKSTETKSETKSDSSSSSGSSSATSTPSSKSE
jgi:putative FmdB family regulatory protein